MFSGIGQKERMKGCERMWRVWEGGGGEESSAGSSRLWLLSAMIAWLDALDCLIWTILYFVYNWQDCVEGSNGGGGGTKNPFYSIYTCTYTRCIGFLWPFLAVYHFLTEIYFTWMMNDKNNNNVKSLQPGQAVSEYSRVETATCGFYYRVNRIENK